MKKILLSLLTIGVIGGAVYGATSAFFSDTEVSTGNVLAAGAIDLLVANDSYYNGVAQPNTSWDFNDLTIQKFFNFTDLKPGDWGEDTIGIDVNDNEAWACANVQISANLDNGITEPEDEVDGTPGDNSDGTPDGDLGAALNFIFWYDDGDNVFESDETTFVSGPAENVLNGGTMILADSTENNVGGSTGDGLDPNQTYYIGKAWCFGELGTANPEPQDGQGNIGTNGPDVRGTGGITCDGTNAGNITQTDVLIGDISFYAEQHRNNDQFQCADVDWPTPETPQLVGSNLSSYVAPNPQDCDATVTSVDSIQAAVDAATAGQTICVDDGTYAETVVINTPLTLASMTGATNSATITGGIQIESSDVTVKGFIINPGDVPADPGNIGVYINGSYSNIAITDNDIDGTGINNDRGILNTTGSTLSNITIENNQIHDVVTGMYTNPFTGNIDVMYNDFYNNSAGIGGFTGVTAMYNEFSGGGEAIGADSNYDGVSTISYNNFVDGSAINDYGVSSSVLAENNFFGPDGGATQTSGNVDYDPEAASAYIHN